MVDLQEFYRATNPNKALDICQPEDNVSFSPDGKTLASGSDDG